MKSHQLTFDKSLEAATQLEELQRQQAEAEI